MSDTPDLTPDDVKEILRLVDEAQFDEFELETPRLSIRFRRGDAPARPGAEPAAERPADAAPGLVDVTAPMVGTFYRAPGPGEPPFVELGSAVDESSQVCILEVMKLMSAVTAGARGVVAEICRENGEVVGYGDLLLPHPPGMISLVDTTVRDGHQSLWSADALTTAMIAAIAPVMDRAGFHAIDFSSSTHMAMTVRSHAEDPWERIRVVRELMPRTRLGFITPGMRFMAWQRAPVEVMELALGCVIRSGIRRIWVAESMNDVETDLRVARIAKAAGAEEVLAGLVYSISPVHTDAYYATRAHELAASADIDVLNLKDPGGLLTPERVRTLVPALLAAAPGLPLEVHSHCTATMAPLVYLEAARLGASFVCTAARPLANGSSQPSAEATIANLRAAGFDVEIDEDALAEMSAYFTELAARIGRPTGVPAEYDAAIYRHQLPGGMTATLRRQLREVGQEARWDEVLAEIPRVREELGWPIMVTPLSQFVGVQAFLNVTTGTRWSQIPDEVVKYVLGQYGPLPGELDPGVEALVLASPKAEQLRHAESGLDLADARARHGDAISDELLLLRMMLPAEQVDAMLAHSGAGATPALARHPVVELVAGLAQRGLRELDVSAPGVRVRAR